jgi:chitinase
MKGEIIMKHKFKLISVLLSLFLLFLLPLGEQPKALGATIRISSQNFTLTVNHYKTLRITGTNQKVTWSSGNKKVATVSSKGRVTAIAPGTTTIYASVSGRKLNCKVTVIQLSKSSTVLEEGTAKNLKVLGTSRAVTWTSSNKSIATVSYTGKVTGKAPGTATIYASVSGKKLACTIKVLKSSRPVDETATITSAAIPEEQTDKIVGYYASWSRYSGYTPDKIDVLKLTHVHYAFANIDSNLKISLGYPDIDLLNIKGLNDLKLKNPTLKTIISVGGYSWSGRFSDVALTEASRSNFADSCVDFIVTYGFDGIDIDWEYPVVGGLSTNIKRPDDKYNFTLLMKTLREKLDARGAIDGKKYILSFAGAAGSWYLNQIELNKIDQYIDYVNVMTYDLHGPWEPYTNFNAPL